MVARTVDEVAGRRTAKYGDGGVRRVREQSADDVMAEETAASDYKHMVKCRSFRCHCLALGLLICRKRVFL